MDASLHFPLHQRKVYPRARNISRTIMNTAWTSRAGAAPGRLPRPRHAAGRIVGPVAVESDDAPLPPPADSEAAGVLEDGVVAGMASAVADAGDAVAEPARDRLRGALPWPESNFSDPLDAEDFKIRVPVRTFLVAELGMDLNEHSAIVA